MGVSIRAATPSDQDWLRQLNRLAYRDVVTQEFGEWDDPAQTEQFDSKLQQAAFRIVELEGRPIAAVWSKEYEDHVYLHELIVLPEFQDRGIGSHILSLEIEQAEALRKPLRLHVLELSRARGLYARNGFVETSRDDAFVDMERPAQTVAGQS
jgi:ribosomal protein S18 acetylase RimI-like enzyme